MIPVKIAQRRIAILWFCGAGLLFVYCILLSISSGDTNLADFLWSWFLPTVMPTLSLILGVLVSDSLKKSADEREVEIFIYRTAILISFFYLSCVWSTILLQPFSRLKLVDLLQMSQLWLAPLQGLTSAALGAFFVQRTPKKNQA